MQFSFILFLTAAFIVTTAICIDSKNLQGSTYRNRLRQTMVTKNLQSKTILNWVYQQNHNNGTSKIIEKTNSKNISVSTPTPNASLGTIENIDNHIEISTQRLQLLQVLIAPRKFKSCPNGFVRDADGACVVHINYIDSDE